jgi:hypothetical protein
LINTYFKIKPFKLQDLEIGYKEVQNFNSDLIDKEIAANNYYFNYNMGTNFNFGWFTIFLHFATNDNNTRNFCLLLSIMSIRFERRLNYQYIASKTRTTVYLAENLMLLNYLKTKDEKIVEAKSWFYNANWLQVFNLLKTIVNNGLTECKPNLVINSLIDYWLTFMEPEVILLPLLQGLPLMKLDCD